MTFVTDVARKRNQVREMMKHAWKGYKEKAWTENEVRPISGRGHSANIFGNGKTGATIVDALGNFYHWPGVYPFWRKLCCLEELFRYSVDHGAD